MSWRGIVFVLFLLELEPRLELNLPRLDSIYFIISIPTSFIMNQLTHKIHLEEIVDHGHRPWRRIDQLSLEISDKHPRRKKS